MAILPQFVWTFIAAQLLPLTFVNYIHTFKFMLTSRRIVATSTIHLPVSYSIGTAQNPNLSTLATTSKITLTSLQPLLTLDYGTEVLGIPTLDVDEISGLAQIELRYSEEFAGLDNVNGDGPFNFANGLTNMFRAETFEIAKPGNFQSYFAQGGLRWQSIRLLTNGSITISGAGLQGATILPSNQLPGAFNSSNGLYEDIWNLGAKAVQTACVEKGGLKPTWDITDDGALIYGQQTGQSVKGMGYSNYTMSFTTKIVRGGTGWRVATPAHSYGPYFVLTSNYPTNSTFVNTNTTLLPANNLIVGYGWGLVNVTTLTTGPVQNYPVQISISENEWLRITTSITPQGFLVLVNNVTIATISYTEGIAFASHYGSSSVTAGSWGFGPYQDQVAYVKNVEVTAANGTTIYENSMASTEILKEYGMGTNDASVCLDGSKRDRLVWIGDFVHTARILGASMNRTDFISGVMDFVFARQITSVGYVPMDAQMGTSIQYKEVYYPANFIIMDYQIFFLVTIGDYYQMTGDLALVDKYWQQTKLVATAILSFVDSASGLLGSEYAYFFSGPSNGTAPSALMVLALRQLIPVAVAVGDNSTAQAYKSAADAISTSINEKLWNDELGFYSLSLTSPEDFSAAGLAFAIRAGIANATQATRSISNLPLLKYGLGYMDDTTVTKSNETQLSPNILGFLLESLFIANMTMGVQTLDVATDLLENFWSKMVTQNEYYTGASWEYLYPDGSPGIGLYTSLSHPWGGAPTYILPQYVLGISALDPGYKKWQFKPLVYGMGLDTSEGVVPTPQGGIHASWKLAGGGLLLNVEAPSGTTGTISLPFVPSDISVSCEGRYAGGALVEVNGGSSCKIFALE
ncbi:hypothetical protein G7Y89_g14606 [Cudoniella acicularis]|uniref:Alpha-L-rhamnosidase C-terminal domain-containing protein n=1 Tax=Cudoniella acicularis TaxID=354080 RepID=A0A8H4R0X0_9HELO|nr:hypothetical protein G7Y89_g14606 [Cudoniella acicularis]